MPQLKKFIILIGDLVVLYASLALTLLIRYRGHDWTERFNDHILPFSIIFILWIIVFYLFNLYRYKTLKQEDLIRVVSTAVTTATALSIAAFYFLPTFFQLTPKINMLIFGAIALALKYAWQNFVLFRMFAEGAEKIIVIGDSNLLSNTVSFINENPHAGYSVESWIQDLENFEFEALKNEITKTGARLIVIQDHLTEKTNISNIIYSLIAKNINVVSFWNFYESIFDKVPLEELEEGWFIENITSHKPMYSKIKRIIDIIFSAILIVIFSPIMVLAAILIWTTSKGLAIFKQERVGKNDEIFTLYKFRTMYKDNSGPLAATKNDSRITPVGKVLRASHLDELPQLFNILKGDISFLGPRPERKELVEKYSTLPYYDMRHIIKPGVTGWAQINYKPSANLEEAKEKLCFDLYYLKNRSIFLDALIALKTIRYFFTTND